MATACAISTRRPKYPGEVSIPRGHAGQTMEAVILWHQVRTIDLSRVTALEIGGRVQHVSSPGIRQQVRSALSHISWALTSRLSPTEPRSRSGLTGRWPAWPRAVMTPWSVQRDHRAAPPPPVR
jgi:hypothetical protein